jgi:hypothetical protein
MLIMCTVSGTVLAGNGETQIGGRERKSKSRNEPKIQERVHIERESESTVLRIGPLSSEGNIRFLVGLDVLGRHVLVGG